MYKLSTVEAQRLLRIMRDCGHGPVLDLATGRLHLPRAASKAALQLAEHFADELRELLRNEDEGAA